jgi:hypothetical protein
MNLDEPYKVKCSLRVYEALKAREKTQKGWERILALNFPFDRTYGKNIECFNDLPHLIRKNYYKQFIIDNEILCKVENTNGFRLVEREEPEMIDKLRVNIFTPLYERLEMHQLARLFKTTLLPFDLDRLSQFQFLFYKLLIRVEKEVNWSIPSLGEKPTPEQTKANQKANDELRDFQKATVATCAHYDCDILWSGQ